MSADKFDTFFDSATNGSRPFAYQRRLAEISECRSLLIDVPTGCGKTAAVNRRRASPFAEANPAGDAPPSTEPPSQETLLIKAN